jgi:hypothetical protein
MRLWEQRPRRSTRSRSTTISLFSIDLGSNAAYFYDGEVMEFALIALRSSLAAMANDSYGARILRSFLMANPDNFPASLAVAEMDLRFSRGSRAAFAAGVF